MSPMRETSLLRRPHSRLFLSALMGLAVAFGTGAAPAAKPSATGRVATGPGGAPAAASKNGKNEAALDDEWHVPSINCTPKLFVGGKQARPDSGYSLRVESPDGQLLGEVPDGNRKDIRNAVEAAHKATGWAGTSGHSKAQILYYIAENLAGRAGEFAGRINAMTGCGLNAAREEVETSISRLFTYAAYADKYDGQVHNVPIRGVALAMNEPIGVMGVVCPDEYPLLGLVSLVAPAIAMGNTVVAVPSQAHPLAATDFYTVLETSDVPAGVVNIVTGYRTGLGKTLAEHDDVDAVWYFGSHEGVKAIEFASAHNMKRTFAEWKGRNWLDPAQGEGREFLREATQVKNIWIPYGEQIGGAIAY